jgi:hypothetical protein
VLKEEPDFDQFGQDLFVHDRNMIGHHSNELRVRGVVSSGREESIFSLPFLFVLIFKQVDVSMTSVIEEKEDTKGI